MDKRSDEVLLAKGMKHWPVELAESLLANPLPWGPPTYALGIGYTDDPTLEDQSHDFMALAMCVDGAYTRHHDMGKAETWATTLLRHREVNDPPEQPSTQDLLDVVFLSCRGERFCDGLIRQREALLRTYIQEVVRRIHSDTPPVFIVQEVDTKNHRELL